MTNVNEQKPSLFVDNKGFSWEKDSISGAEIRALANVPEGVELYLEVPGEPDHEILPDTVVELNKAPGLNRFSTQPVGSQAG